MTNKLIIISFILMSGILQATLWRKTNSINSIVELNQELTQKTRELHNLKQRNDILLKNVQLIKKNHAYIEEPARSILGMIKKNETYYRIIENNNENLTK